MTTEQAVTFSATEAARVVRVPAEQIAIILTALAAVAALENMHVFLLLHEA
jgi:hypothetical protein